jgi:isopentenyl diphosphate isomerase/L-lactate dehydrogenase-like FMN-dependent dehydrogenase
MTDQQYGDCQFENYFDSVKGRTPGWGSALGRDDLTWPRSLTTLPILLNGIQHSDDARGAKDYGVEVICCPNRDGRPGQWRVARPQRSARLSGGRRRDGRGV